MKEGYGGTSGDTFAFAYLFQSSIDVIKDFQGSEGNKIQIDKVGFGAISNSQFSYNSSTGALFFDASPSASITPVQFTTLENKPTGFSTISNIVLI